MIQVSVVVCTLHRPGELVALLDSLKRQRFAQADFEVVVVDNDHECSSRELVAGYTGSIENLTYSSEPSLGLSNARMRGARTAKGEWLVYLDDDCVAEDTFLEQLDECIGRAGNPGVIGGPVLPAWPCPLPAWLTLDLYPYLSLCNYTGPKDGFELNFPTQYPVGANIAYRKHLLLEMGGFKTEFGRRGDALLSGEETELNFRLQRAGYQIWYCPKAVVHHVIPSARLEKSFFRSRYYWDGRTWALLHLHWFGKQRVRKELVRRMSFNLAGRVYYGAIVRRNPFLAECLVRESIGYIAQAVQILRKGSERTDPVLQVGNA